MPSKKKSRNERRGRPPKLKPTIVYGNALKTIEQLERENQPWAIARFAVGARFVEGETSYCYEILLFQTMDREEANENFTMNRETFREVLRIYGLTCQYQMRSCGEVYGKDTRLRDLYKEYAKGEAKMKGTLDSIRRWQYNLTDLGSREENAEKRAVIRAQRDAKRKEAEDFEKKIKQFRERFCEKNNIIIYTF